LNDGDAGESWSESGITWNNAPANVTASGSGLDPARVTYLGSMVTQGRLEAGAPVSLASAALDAFLRADTDGKVSFVITRETSSDTLNTAFCSREDTSFAAPALQFVEIPLRHVSSGFRGSTFELAFTGLSPASSYVLKRSANLSDGFTTVVSGPFKPASVSATVIDPFPPAERAFYRLEVSQ
jgi:hypothetical protein